MLSTLRSSDFGHLDTLIIKIIANLLVEKKVNIDRMLHLFYTFFLIPFLVTTRLLTLAALSVSIRISLH